MNAWNRVFAAFVVNDWTVGCNCLSW